MDMRAIKYITTIVECGSVSRAAEALYISQSALSQYIRKIEQSFSVRFFERQNNKLVLTHAGEIFVREGRDIQLLYNQMCRHIADAASPNEKTVHMGISQFYSKYFLPKLLPVLAQSYPDICLKITEEISGVLEDMVLRGTLDFCAVPMNIANVNLEYEAIYMEEIFLALPKDDPLCAMAQPSPEPGLPYLDLALLKDRSFIKMPPAQKFSKMGDSLCEKAGFVPRVVCELMSWDAINRLIGSGMGVGFVPGIIIGTLSPENSPNYYKIKSIASSMRPYAVAYSKNRLLSDASRTTIEQLRICLNSTEANKAGMPQYRFDS